MHLLRTRPVLSSPGFHSISKETPLDRTVAARRRYAFDNSMSRGAVALMGYLGLASITMIAFFALLLVLLRRERELAEVAQADDFIVSNKLTCLMLSQISENPGLNAVFTDLSDPEGSEIYLKPAGDYVQPGRAVSFYTVAAAARRRGEVAIGYRLAAHATD